LSSFLIFLAMSVDDLKEVFQFSMLKESFEQRLRYFIWEGRENYAQRRQLRHALEKAKGGEGSAEFDLPEWARFVELVRSFLDAPEALPPLALLAKEMAFRAAGPNRLEPDEHLRMLFASNNRARQFIFATASYLVHAARLPKEFSAQISQDVNQLLSGPPKEASPTLL